MISVVDPNNALGNPFANILSSILGGGQQQAGPSLDQTIAQLQAQEAAEARQRMFWFGAVGLGILLTAGIITYLVLRKD